MEARTAVEHTGEVLLTDLFLVLTEVKVSAMEIVMQYKTADY